jgi:hypothetical protein
MDDFQKDLLALESTVKQAREKCAQFHALNREMASVRANALQLESDGRKELTAIMKELKKHQRQSTTEDPLTRALMEQCNASMQQMENVRLIRPMTGSLFLRFFLGRVNVRLFNESDLKKLRTEYHKFKDRTTVLYILIPMLMLSVQYFRDYLEDSQWSMRLQHLWMLYYYVSLALRENILRMNGSKINSWWTNHHHLASVASLIFLTWPHGTAYLQFKDRYLVTCIMQGFVQLVQNRYQKQRHYTLLSLGRASPMDLTSTETISQSPPSSSLAIVLVPVFITQMVQVYIGYCLLRVCFVDLNVWQSPSMYKEEMQTLSTGILAVVLGIGNFIATINTLRRKKNCCQKESTSVGTAPPLQSEKDSKKNS